ncbi:MAG: nucleoside deaminase [Candidatus Methylacidiphilales bacterium]|nr:nucleoside deaminase [Candidatus Methylacidiphilales bacterium]
MSTSNADHEKFIKRAIELSARAALEYSTGGAFGCVIVKDGKILSEGMNRVVASHDPTWHGEMEAIRSACITTQSFKLTGATLYSSAEPCPMCMATCYWADIKEVFYAATVDDAFEYGNFDDRPIYEQLALPKEQRSIKMTQICQAEAVEVWKQYQAKPDKVNY